MVKALHRDQQAVQASPGGARAGMLPPARRAWLKETPPTEAAWQRFTANRAGWLLLAMAPQSATDTLGFTLSTEGTVV